MLLNSISMIFLSICKSLNMMKKINMNINNDKEKINNIEWLNKNNNIEDIFYILYLPHYIINNDVLNDEIIREMNNEIKKLKQMIDDENLIKLINNMNKRNNNKNDFIWIKPDNRNTLIDMINYIDYEKFKHL